MNTASRLLTLDVWLDRELRDSDIDFIGQRIYQDFSVLKDAEHVFTPYGYTKMWLLSESHAVIHTYPEHAYFALDLFICNPSVNLDQFASSILTELPVRESQTNIQHRGFPQQMPAVSVTAG